MQQNVIQIRPAHGGFIVTTLSVEPMESAYADVPGAPGLMIGEREQEHVFPNWGSVLEFLQANPCPDAETLERAGRAAPVIGRLIPRR